jgi:hypothetical protein
MGGGELVEGERGSWLKEKGGADILDAKQHCRANVG